MKNFRRNYRSHVLMVLLFGCACLALQSSGRNRQSITEDISQGPSFKFGINARVPDYTFKIVPEVQPADKYGNAQSTVKDILVFRGDSKKPSQHLTGCGLSDVEAPRENSDWFRAEDFNFDGYSDIFLLTSWGATGNEYGCVWLFDPETKAFNYSDEFSKLAHYQLDPSTRTITSFNNGGGGTYSAERFKVEKNHLVLVFREVKNWDFKSSKSHCVRQERRGNKMVTTLDKWWVDNADGKNDPCVASGFWN